MVLLGKTPENVLQEELLREKAEVLSRAGERVSEILEQLHCLREDIEGIILSVNENPLNGAMAVDHPLDSAFSEKQKMLEEINQKISHYNDLREDAKLRYHYLIITREALGMRKHHWVETIYKIPERKGYLRNL